MFFLLAACAPSGITVGDGVDTPRDTYTPPADTGDPIEDAGSNGGDPSAPDVDFDPPGGAYDTALDVTVSLGEGEEAWYTTDGSLPTDAATPYVGPIAVSGSVELRVLVRNADGLEAVGTESYIQVSDALATFDSNLPLLVLYADGDLDDAEEGYIPVSFQLHDVLADGRSRVVGAASLSSRAAIKVRGSSTAYDPKHSYALELREEGSDDDENEELLDFPPESDWVLYAPLAFDRGLIRNALMYQLSNDAGRYAPRTRFVEVFAVDGGGSLASRDYLGVYTLTESIKRGPDRVAITEILPDDVAAPEVTGGYIFKRDRVGEDEDGFDAGTARGTFEFEDPLIYVDPEEDVIARAQAQYLSGAVDDFADALASGDDYSTMIDVDAWVDNHILNLYAKNPDALRLSQYMYKDREGPIVAGPIWDFDRTMGCDDDDRAEDPTWWDPTNQTWDTTAMFTYGWYEPLFDDPAFTSVYWARWDELLNDTLSKEHVNDVIDTMAAELTEAAPRNYERWSSYPPRGGSFESEIQLLRDWLDARHDWIAACLADHPENPEGCRGD